MFGFNKKITIGRLEKVNIPILGLNNVDAKIDTGAYRGSIHATEIREEKEDNKKVLKFKVFDENHPEYQDRTYTFKKYKKRKFKSARFEDHYRFVISIEIEIAGQKIKVELSLTNRSDMRYPILLGRRSLKKKFLVDVDRKNI
ncbi:peptidase [Candidatus Parcubacteria bacterium]|nr:peptidase [Candidatus Parcubacteria bacterium]